MTQQTAQDVLTYWFETLEPMEWWSGGDHIDEQIKKQFTDLVAKAMAGELYRWREEPEGRLAEIICLDQFPRNIFRGTSKAFSGDGRALILAQEAVLGEHDKGLEESKRTFLYMPFMHSESLAMHRWADRLFHDAKLELSLKSLAEHTQVIETYGRYPSRNAALGRESTPEELAYLADGNTWGQGSG